MKPLSDCRLYAFVDFAYLHGRNPVTVTQELCAGGADLIQLRAKTIPIEVIQRLTPQLLSITERANVGLVINDYPALAATTGAPFCHLGQEDFFKAGYTHVSQVAPAQGKLGIGLSSHSPEQAERAVAAGAAYLGVGPVYATATKPMAVPVTLDYVRWAASHIRIPWFAIGGITLENLRLVMEAGARRICVVSAILTAPNLVEACQAFKKQLTLIPGKEI